jgi:hypothetical protein
VSDQRAVFSEPLLLPTVVAAAHAILVQAFTNTEGHELVTPHFLFCLWLDVPDIGLGIPQYCAHECDPHSQLVKPAARAQFGMY